MLHGTCAVAIIDIVRSELLRVAPSSSFSILIFLDVQIAAFVRIASTYIGIAEAYDIQQRRRDFTRVPVWDELEFLLSSFVVPVLTSHVDNIFLFIGVKPVSGREIKLIIYNTAHTCRTYNWRSFSRATVSDSGGRVILDASGIFSRRYTDDKSSYFRSRVIGFFLHS